MNNQIAMIIYAFLVRETITCTLRTRLFLLDESISIENGDGEYQQVQDGALLLVVDRVGAEQPVVEQLLDLAELRLHHVWGFRHDNAETRTPFDIRTPEAGGRETPAIPF